MQSTAEPQLRGPASTGTSPGDEISLLEFLALLWSNKWLIAAITTAVTALAVAYALLAPQWYRAEVLLAPADVNSMRGLSGNLGGLTGLAGLASLAGVEIGTGDTAEPLAVLQSRNFTAAFIEKHGLLPILFAKRWDAEHKRWKGSDPEKWPDLREGVRYFDKKVRRVREDTKTGLVTMTIDWRDPKVAAAWANLLVEQVNERMRQRTLVEAESNISYLRQELTATNVVTLHEVIGRLLETALQKVMLARGNKEFSFRFIDRADPPKWRERPKRPLTVVLGAVLGGVLSIIVVFLRRSLRARPLPDVRGKI